MSPSPNCRRSAVAQRRGDGCRDHDDFQVLPEGMARGMPSYVSHSHPVENCGQHRIVTAPYCNVRWRYKDPCTCEPFVEVEDVE